MPAGGTSGRTRSTPYPNRGGKHSGAPAKASPTGSKRSDRTLTALISAELWGDQQGVVDQSVPIGRVARRIVSDLENPDQRLDWHLLALIWERMEGRVPDRLEVEATIRGVIALPVLRASEMDWAADAVSVLTETARAAPVYELPPAAVRVDDVVDAVASLSPDEDD